METYKKEQLDWIKNKRNTLAKELLANGKSNRSAAYAAVTEERAARLEELVKREVQAIRLDK
jgi:hypothetical protein